MLCHPLVDTCSNCNSQPFLCLQQQKPGLHWWSTCQPAVLPLPPPHLRHTEIHYGWSYDSLTFGPVTPPHTLKTKTPLCTSCEQAPNQSEPSSLGTQPESKHHPAFIHVTCLKYLPCNRFWQHRKRLRWEGRKSLKKYNSYELSRSPQDPWFDTVHSLPEGQLSRAQLHVEQTGCGKLHGQKIIHVFLGPELSLQTKGTVCQLSSHWANWPFRN